MIVAEFLGSAFDKQLMHEKVLINYGTGANGKSVLFEIVRNLFGGENISSVSLSNLLENKGYYRSDIANTLLNFGSELSSKKFDSEIFKQLCSGEPVYARAPYQTPVEMNNYARLSFNCNELPYPSERTQGYFRTFLIVPFSVSIPKEKQDLFLSKRISESELPGILNWVLEGLVRLRQSGGKFADSISSQSMLTQYVSESDNVGLFMEEFYRPSVDLQEYVALKMLYSEYKDHCFEYGYKPLNKTNMKKRLQLLGYELKRRSKGFVVFCEKIDKSLSETPVISGLEDLLDDKFEF